MANHSRFPRRFPQMPMTCPRSSIPRTSSPLRVDRPMPLAGPLAPLARPGTSRPACPPTRRWVYAAQGGGVAAGAGRVGRGSTDRRNVLNRLLFGAARAVAAIPEGLPAVVTGALALGTKRMTRRRAVISKLHPVETLGQMTGYCHAKKRAITSGGQNARKPTRAPG